MTPLEMLKAEDAIATSPTRGGKPVGTFAIRDLSVLAYANGFTLWHYKSARFDLAFVLADGFFNQAADMMAVGDMIMTSGAGGATVLVVAAAGNERVTVARMA